MKTDFTKKEKERLEHLRNEYLLLDSEITRLKEEIKAVEVKQSKTFQEYFGMVHPEYKETFDKRLLPYGWQTG